MVLLGNNKACRVVDIGPIRIKMHDGLERVLQEVRYVLELKRNLILGMLDQIGCSFKAENGCLKVLKGSMVIMKGVRISSIYVLIGKAVIGEVAMLKIRQLIRLSYGT